MNIAIFPARSGSKRIKNKNIKNFFSKPIICYSLKIAKKSKLFDLIVTSSDSDKILNLSKKMDLMYALKGRKNCLTIKHQPEKLLFMQ